MARHIEPTPEQQKEWEEWLADKDDNIRQMAAKKPPELLYRMKSTGKRVIIYAYGEDGTATVIVSSDYNLVAMNRICFGVKLDDLEECDLPGPDEKVGFLDDPLKGIVEEMMAKITDSMPTKHQRMVHNVSAN